MATVMRKSAVVLLAALCSGSVLAGGDVGSERAQEQVQRTMVVDFSGKPPFKRHFVEVPADAERADFARFEEKSRPDARMPTRSAHRGLSRPASPR